MMLGRDIGLWIDERIDWMNANLGFFFNAVKTVVSYTFEPLEAFLKWLPWPAVVFALGLVSWILVGRTIAIFSVVAMILLGFFGLWESTMETAALMFVTVTLCIAIAVPIGIWASQSDRLDAILRPILDGMQTMPSFVYLVPAIAFFSLGNPPAVIATLVYAVPPAVRLTNLGIRQVSQETHRGSGVFRCDSLAVDDEGKDSVGNADDYGRGKPNDIDGARDGGNRVAGRCEWSWRRRIARVGSVGNPATRCWRVWE